MTAPSRTLGVFAKRPVPGKVKTRLAAATSPQWAAQVAEACLLDVVGRLAHVEANHVLAYAPRGAEPYFAQAARGFTLVPQGDGDLGERMAAFFTQQFAVLGAYMGSRHELMQCIRLVERRVFLPVVDSVFPLEKLQEAQQRMERREMFGKIVVTP